MRGLSQFAVDLDFLVEEYAGSKGVFPPKQRRKRNTLFVCTIEKAHSLLNSLIEHDRQDQVGLVVVDEVRKCERGLMINNYSLVSIISCPVYSFTCLVTVV